MDLSTIIILTIFFLPLVLFIVTLIIGKKRRKKFEAKIHEIDGIIIKLKEERDNLKSKYSPITDVEKHALQLLDEVEEDAASKRDLSIKLLADANFEAERIRDEAKSLKAEANLNLKDSQQKAVEVKNNARDEASKIINFAEEQAKIIAGDAYEAKSKADSYEKAILAMRNTIEGYKDEYIIPNHSTLDDLADEFGHKEAGEKLKEARKRVRNMIKDGFAATCDYAEINRKTYAIHFVIDAFNGKVDSAMSKVKHDNYGKVKQEIIDAFALVNHNGAPFRNARINQEFLDARLTELKWAVAAFELQKLEREEQAEIKAQIREEERAIREMEKAQKEAEKEEKIIQQALERARLELAQATEDQKANYESQLAELEIKLREAEEKGQRAMSMAQQTRRGHVYVISNIGSFGENVFKIGMTRRLEPMERVNELGDASVPFSFDVHAMIYSEDAPSLEKALHRRFDLQSLNKVNPRKEFFKTTIAEVKQAVETHGISDVRWTLKADAAEYRQSLALEKQQMQESVA